MEGGVGNPEVLGVVSVGVDGVVVVPVSLLPEDEPPLLLDDVLLLVLVLLLLLFADPLVVELAALVLDEAVFGTAWQPVTISVEATRSPARVLRIATQKEVA